MKRLPAKAFIFCRCRGGICGAQPGSCVLGTLFFSGAVGAVGAGALLLGTFMGAALGCGLLAGSGAGCGSGIGLLLGVGGCCGMGGLALLADLSSSGCSRSLSMSSMICLSLLRVVAP